MTFAAAAALVGCSTTGLETDPNVYTLVAVDGRSLPASAKDLPDGYAIIFASLDFGPGLDLVRYTRTTRDPDQRIESSTTEHNFARMPDSIAINLCPSLALCLIRTELVGPATGTQLRLTHVLGTEPRSTYQFEQNSRPR